jgi:hypothetical protein
MYEGNTKEQVVHATTREDRRVIVAMIVVLQDLTVRKRWNVNVGRSHCAGSRA